MDNTQCCKQLCKETSTLGVYPYMDLNMLFTFVQCTNFACTDCEGGSPDYNITENQLYTVLACTSIIASVMWYLLLKCDLSIHFTSQADHGLVRALLPVHLWLQPVFHH